MTSGQVDRNQPKQVPHAADNFQSIVVGPGFKKGLFKLEEVLSKQIPAASQ